MLIGYIRVSKADGSQVLDLQRDALIAAGVATEHLYEDFASGTKNEREGVKEERVIKWLMLNYDWQLRQWEPHKRMWATCVESLVLQDKRFIGMSLQVATSEKMEKNY